MDRDDLLNVAADWSFWNSSPPDSVPRSVDLPTELRSDIALVVQGVRRCGKSTLLAQLMARYNLDPQRCLFVNFEDPRLANALDYSTLQALVDAFDEKRGGDTVFLFDEIQSVAGWQRWLRAQLDRPRGRRFVVTGSNAHLLSGELASSLTGRHFVVELFPFAFTEYLLVRPEAELIDYLNEGGFPAPLTAADADRLRRAYFNDIIERDVRERVAARSSLPLRQLVQMVFETMGSELSARRVAAAIGIAPDTASLYLGAVVDAYMALPCEYFAWSARLRAARNRKYYPIDTGLRRVAVTPTGADRGKMLECATYLELRRRFREIFYWRGRAEVDFVVLVDGEPLPIQVSWEGIEERHQRALDAFYEEYPRAHEAILVTADSWANAFTRLHDAKRM